MCRTARPGGTATTATRTAPRGTATRTNPPEPRCALDGDGPAEEAVWDRVAGPFRDPEQLRAELQQRREEGSPTRTAAEQTLQDLRARVAGIPHEQYRLGMGRTQKRSTL